VPPDLTIRYATVEDLPRLESLAREFCSASKFIGPFEPERFIETWTGLLDGPGAIILAEQGGEAIGAIGGIAVMEPYSRELAATEMFWFCTAAKRGGGLLLYREFENWARCAGCTRIRLCHMMDLAPQRLNRLYERMGYEGAEIHYSKELSCPSEQPQP
jgi:hypothetical protein